MSPTPAGRARARASPPPSPRAPPPAAASRGSCPLYTPRAACGRRTRACPQMAAASASAARRPPRRRRRAARRPPTCPCRAPRSTCRYHPCAVRGGPAPPALRTRSRSGPRCALGPSAPRRPRPPPAAARTTAPGPPTPPWPSYQSLRSCRGAGRPRRKRKASQAGAWRRRPLQTWRAPSSAAGCARRGRHPVRAPSCSGLASRAPTSAREPGPSASTP
mmetsp:Transcript_19825/g.46986  ORF Transcript_19825/g.46986 Transcript_19825/m.46986 type:complete len:219 (+) Transcript_19825:191-847(+)|eukprot:scaffold68646_cov48-Phaeocystis_antarctica.AAC.1